MVERTTKELTSLPAFYKPQEIPKMPDQTEAKNKKFQETAGFTALNAALTSKRDAAVAQLEAQHDYEQSTLTDAIQIEESLIIQQALAFLRKFLFDREIKTLAEVMGCLKEVLDKKSPKQILDEKELTRQKHDQNYYEKEIVQINQDKEKREKEHLTKLGEMHFKAAKAKDKLDIYKDSSPVPLDSLYEIYAVMENIRGRQDNVENIKQLLPNCIDQFNTRCENMITELNGLKAIQVMDDDKV